MKTSKAAAIRQYLATNPGKTTREFFRIETEDLAFLLSAFAYFPGKLSISKTDSFLDYIGMCPEYGMNDDFTVVWDVYKHGRNNPKRNLKPIEFSDAFTELLELDSIGEIPF